MRVKWGVLLSSASILVGSASASAQGPFTLSGSQLDGVLPTYQYDPSLYQLRVALEAITVTEPDRARNSLLIEDFEELMAAQQLPAEEPEARCTPARKALLALAGRSEASTWEAASPQGPPLATAASADRATAGAAASRPEQLLAAESPDPAGVGGPASPAQLASSIASGSRPAAIGDNGSSLRQTAASSRPRAVQDLGSSARNSSPEKATSAGMGGKKAPAAPVASRIPKVEVPARTVQSDRPSRPSGASAVRGGAGANARDIVARVRSDVSRALSAVQGGGFRLR